MQSFNIQMMHKFAVHYFYKRFSIRGAFVDVPNVTNSNGRNGHILKCLSCLFILEAQAACN